MPPRKFFIPAFKPAEAEPNSVWCFIGARRSGKSSALKEVIYHQRQNIDIAIGMTPTKSTADMFRSFMPTDLVYDEGYNAAKVERFVDELDKRVKSNRPLRGAMLLDDCSYDEKAKRTKTEMNIYNNSRHYNFALFNTTQSGMSIWSKVRGNIDYVFAFRETTRIIRRKLWEQYFGVFDQFSDFEKVFQKATQNYGALVLDRTTGGNTVADTIRYFRATPSAVPPFRLGKRVFFYLEKQVQRIRKKRDREQGPHAMVVK